MVKLTTESLLGTAAYVNYLPVEFVKKCSTRGERLDVFSHKNYKDIIILVSKERKQQFGQRFSLAKVAAASGIQKTYLSKVLNSDTHLNPDQLSAACEFLKCTDDESEFILLLRDQATATHPKRQEALKTKIAVLLARVRQTSSSLKDAGRIADPSVSWVYYTDVHMQLVHLFLTIPAFQANIDQIGKALGITQERLLMVLLQLQRHGMVASDGHRHKALEFNLHLEPSSPIYRPYRFLQRIRSLEKIDRIQDETSCYAMTAAFAADEDTYDEIKAKILGLIKSAQKSAVAAKAKHVFQLNIDFFRWDS